MFTGSYFIIGWAKPVPIDIRRFREPLVDFGFTALAGPAANGIQVAIYAGLYHLSTTLGAPLWVQYLCFVGTAINLFLGLFNLIPIPPLDGSRVVAALLPTNAALAYLSIERFGFMLVFFLLWSGVLNPFYRAVGALLYRILS
jgi:Zn-dependent protease